MGKYFPPSLQARGQAIKGGYGPSNYNTTDYTEIFFNMPAQNDVNALFGLDGSNGGHVQFTLKTKSNNTTALNNAYTPDYVTMYFNAKGNYSPNGTILTSNMAHIVYYGSDLYSLVFSNRLYQNPHDTTEVGPLADTDYTIQIRFGDSNLSAANQWSPYPTEINGLQLNFTGFANWRANAVAQSQFGEWSNTQTFYAYGPYKATLTANVNKWLPTFTFEYSTQYSDQIASIEVRCQYILPSGEVRTETENFSGDLGTPGYFKLTRSINIAPTDTLYVQVVPITQHNTLINDPVYMTYAPANPNNNGIVYGPYSNATYPGGKIDDGDPNLPLGDIGRDPLLVTEERKDGVIAKRILSPVISGINGPYSLNIYRFDYFTREAVLIASDIDLSAGAAPYIFKDYCVEMGTQYQYAGVVQDKDGREGVMLWEMFSPFASGSDPFAELDKLEFTVLTSKDCQLRFQGNPTVSGFKRVVPEAFQTTIGSEYPYYSRVGKSNYRTMQFGGVVSINFDFTSLFLELDSTNPSYEKRGLLWEKNLIVPIDKVYDQQQISLNRRRFNINNPFIAVTGDDNNPSGPATIYDEHLLASRKKKYSTQQTSDMIYLERRFREKAMSWLSDGKPKLFRSETEGNMIVIVSAPTFTPLAGSQRMVYSVSMTLTEIAEYNLTNLLKYNLLPSTIVADIEPPDTEFSGDYDPNYSDGILRFPDSDSYDIASVQNGRPIAPLLIGYEQGLRVTGGIPPYTFAVLEIPDPAINLHWEQLSRNGVECLRVYGYPASNLPPDIFTAQVTDSVGTTASIQFQFGGTSSTGSVFSIDTIPSMTYTGSPLTPAVVVRENGVPITPASVTYSDNVNAGIATVTVTLPTGGTLLKSFNILQKTINVSPGTLNISKQYDGSVSSAGVTVTGAPTTDVSIGALTIAITPGQFSNKGAGTNKSITVGLALQGAGASNYALNPSSALWSVGTVTPKPITITPNAGQSRVYGTSDPVLTYTLTPGLATGDNISGMLSRTPGSNVGTYNIVQGTLAAGANYVITFTSGVTFAITRAPAPALTWPQPNPIIYGQPLSAAMSPLTNSFGTFNWDAPSTLPTVTNSGYSLSFTPNDLVNYDWSSTTLTRTIAVAVTPKQLTLSGVTGVNRVYDGTTAVSVTGGTLTGIVGSDAVSPVIGPATVASKVVGLNKPISFTLSLGGAAAPNYTVVLSGVPTMNITAKPVTIISAVGQDRAYNGFNSVTVEIVIGGIISGDNVQTDYITVGEIASPLPDNTVPVVVSLTLTGTDRNNYSVPPISATVNITKAPQSAPATPTLVSTSTTSLIVSTDSAQEYSIDGGTTWQSSGAFFGLNPLTIYSVVGRYKETAVLAVSPASSPRLVTTDALTIAYTISGFSGTYDGQQHGATYTVEPSATIMFSLDGGATYTSPTSPTYKDVGTYTIFYKITKVGAYDVAAAVQIIIDALRVTVTADNKTKSLGSPDPAFTYSVSPAIISGDSFTGALTRSPGEAAGNYQILRGTLALTTNYTISYVPGTLNIGGVTITVTPTAGQGKVFEGTEPTNLTYTFSPALQAGDGFTGSLSRAAGENVGAYPINIGTLTLPDSYAITLTPEVFTITQKPITVTALPETKVFGTQDPQLAYNVTPALGGAGLSGNIERTAGEDVGTYPIVQGTLDNPNYAITFSGNIFTITKAPITRTFESYVNSHEYTGSAITPDVQLVDSLTSALLVKDTDYTIGYLNNTNVGTATIVITGINNYEFSKNLSFQITPVVTSLTIEPIGNVTYSGHAITPLPVVKDGATILTINTHYTVSYSNNTEVGTATINVTGVNAYSGNTVSANFDILPGTYSAAITNGPAFSRVYSATATPPVPTVDNNPESAPVRGYYATNSSGPYSTTAPVDAGSYFVKAAIDATNNYESVETAPVAFTISPLVTTFATFSSPSGLTIVYDGAAYGAGIPVVNSVQLTKGTDYTLSPDVSVTNAGVHTWTFTGIGNYAGSTGTFMLTINPYQVPIQLIGAPPKTYLDPDPTFSYNAGTLIGGDFITGTAGRAAGEDAGSYALTLGTLTAGSNYQLYIAPSSSTIFTINPRNLGSYSADWTPGDLVPYTFYYTGSAIEPVVENWNSSVAPASGDYSYVYDNNINPGNAKAQAIPTNGNFTGSATLNFEIQ